MVILTAIAHVYIRFYINIDCVRSKWILILNKQKINNGKREQKLNAQQRQENMRAVHNATANMTQLRNHQKIEWLPILCNIIGTKNVSRK